MEAYLRGIRFGGCTDERCVDPDCRPIGFANSSKVGLVPVRNDEDNQSLNSSRTSSVAPSDDEAAVGLLSKNKKSTPAVASLQMKLAPYEESGKTEIIPPRENSKYAKSRVSSESTSCASRLLQGCAWVFNRFSYVVAKIIYKSCSPFFPGGSAQERCLKVAIVVALIFAILEALGGYMANSLAILNDAYHMATDVLSYAIALVAITIAKRQRNEVYTRGYGNWEVVCGILSVISIWMVTLFLLWEAVARISNPEPIQTDICLVVAVLGLLCNVVVLSVFMHSGVGHTHGGLIGGIHQCDGNCGHLPMTYAPGQSRESSVRELSRKEISMPVMGQRSSSAKSDSFVNNSFVNKKFDLKIRDRGLEVSTDASSPWSPRSLPSPNANNDGSCMPATSSTEAGSKVQNNNLETVLEVQDEMEDGGSSIAMESQMLHVITDIIQSVGVIISSALIKWQPFDIGTTDGGLPRWILVDALITILFAALVLHTTIPTTIECLGILLSTRPDNFDLEALVQDIREIQGVTQVENVNVDKVGSSQTYVRAQVFIRAERYRVEVDKKLDLITRQFKIDLANAHWQVRVSPELPKVEDTVFCPAVS